MLCKEKKAYQEKLLTNFLLSERVPEYNFYCQRKSVLDLSYLYQLLGAFMELPARRISVLLYFLNSV